MREFQVVFMVNIVSVPTRNKKVGSTCVKVSFHQYEAAHEERHFFRSIRVLPPLKRKTSPIELNKIPWLCRIFMIL